MNKEQPINHEEYLPFLNPRWMRAAQNGIYEQTQPSVKGKISSSSNYCKVVNPELADLLKKQGLQVEVLKHDKSLSESITIHEFTKVTANGKNYVVDIQYQQFVLEDKREHLPDYLAFSYRTEQDVINQLNEHNITSKYHDYWTDELFPKPISLINLQTKPPTTNKYGLGYKG